MGLPPPPAVAYVPRKRRRPAGASGAWPAGARPPQVGPLPGSAAAVAAAAVAWSRALRGEAANGGGAEAEDAVERTLSREERALVAARYLGSEGRPAEAPVSRKRGDRRLVFGWDDAEDTSGSGSGLALGGAEGGGVGVRGAGTGRFGDLDDAGARPGGAVWRDVPREAMGAREWRIFYEAHALAIQGAPGDVRPMRDWGESGLPAGLLEAVRRAGYARPTPVQMAAVPLGLAGHDLLAMAETGSGKTAAFLLPLLARVAGLGALTAETAALGPLALVLAPTRELAQQTAREAEKLARGGPIRVACVVGGGGQQSRDVQNVRAGQGAEVLVATPGRLVDSLDSSHLVLSQCRHLVLDEADRMLDMGFEPQVLAILDALPRHAPGAHGPDATAAEATNKATTTQMFSATMPPAVERLARTFLVRPCRIQVGDPGRAAAEAISQSVVFCAGEEEKRARLPSLVAQTPPPVVVFANEKRTVDELTRLLARASRTALGAVAGLHGGMPQDARERVMAGFRAGTIGVLVATDVAGRGIDVDDVRHVVGYDMALTLEGYTHRIGRTGRAGKVGRATTLLTSADDRGNLFGQLRAFLKRAGVARIPPELAQRAVLVPPHGSDILD